MNCYNTTRPDKHGRVFHVPCTHDLTSVPYCSPVHFLQGTRNTWSYITGDPVSTLGDYPAAAADGGGGVPQVGDPGPHLPVSKMALQHSLWIFVVKVSSVAYPFKFDSRIQFV